MRYSAAELMPLIDQVDGARSPWLPGYRVKILDGNCIEASERRLKVLREVQAGALPGKSLVVYEPMAGLVSVFPCEDGHAQERSMLGRCWRPCKRMTSGYKTAMSVPCACARIDNTGTPGSSPASMRDSP